jgi:hypothetical protein
MGSPFNGGRVSPLILRLNRRFGPTTVIELHEVPEKPRTESIVVDMGKEVA